MLYIDYTALASVLLGPHSYRSLHVPGPDPGTAPPHVRGPRGRPSEGPGGPSAEGPREGPADREYINTDRGYSHTDRIY